MTFLNGKMSNFWKAAAVLMIVMIAVVSILIVSGGDAYAVSKENLDREDRVWFGGETWIVINADKVANYKTNYHGILLLSEYVLEGNQMYDKSPYQGGWDGSIIQIYLRGLFEKQLSMTNTEKNSVLTAEKQGGDDPDNPLEQIGLNGERFFLLDAEELYNEMHYGTISYPDAIPAAANWVPRRGGQPADWWLRGNVEYEGKNLGAVFDTSVKTVEIGKYSTHGIRPAFYLDPAQINSVDKDSDGIYVITFKDGSKSTDDAVGEMVTGVRELKRWNNTQDARWLYFGETNSDSHEPAKWRPIGHDGSGTHNTSKGVLSLFAQSFDRGWFGPNNHYCDSKLKSSFDDLVSRLPEGELNAIKRRTLLTENYQNMYKRVDGVAGNKVEDAVYWPLSCYEADAVADTIKLDDTESCSWLRSPATNNNVAYIMKHVYPYATTITVEQDDKDVTPDRWAGYRPVCWLMTDKILFTTPAEGGKISGTVGPDALRVIRSTETKEWKATITDKAHENFTVKPLEKLSCDGSMAVLRYSGAATGEKEFISAIIIDKFDNIRYYGRFKNCTSAEDSSGTIYVRLGDSLNDGDKIYFFNEQLNGDKRTDFASDLKEVAIAGSSHDYAFNGFRWVGNDTDGYTEVYAKYKCSNTNCGAETEVKGVLDAKVTKPGCLTAGKAEYEAKIAWADSLDGKEHTQSHTVNKNALGHSFTNYVSNNDATCTEDGTETAKCDRCEARDTRQAQGSAKGHKWKFDGFKWSGNDKDGYTSAEAKYVCENDSDHKDTVKNVTVSANEIKPTCTEDGKTVYTAKVARTDSLDFTNHSEIKDAKVVEKSGHSFTNYVSNNDATCTEDGTKTAKCDHCDAKDTKPDAGSAKGHEWAAATCTKPKTCTRCGAEEGEPDPGTHSWSDWKVTREPTPDRNGVRTRKCSICGRTETETITASEKLISKMTTKGKTSLVIAWSRMEGAAGYEIYFARCNHKKKVNICKKIKTVSAGSPLKYVKKGLKKHTSYKVFIMAYKLENGVRVYTDTSLTMHTFTGGSDKKYTNAKKVTVKKSSYTLSVGKTAKIKAKVIGLKKGRKLASHTALVRYISSKKDVATVNKYGKIKAQNPGTCWIYAIASNGVRKAVKVTVR